MERLTDRKTAADLKTNYEGLRAAGMPRDMATERYIKLAEYENQEELEKGERWTKENPYLIKLFEAELNDDGEPKIYSMAYQESSRGFHTEERGKDESTH